MTFVCQVSLDGEVVRSYSADGSIGVSNTGAIPSISLSGKVCNRAVSLETQTNLVATLFEDSDWIGDHVIHPTLVHSLYTDPDAFGDHTLAISFTLEATLFEDPDWIGDHVIHPTLVHTLYTDPDAFGDHEIPDPFIAEIESYSPLHWWRMQEGSGYVITDYGSEGNDLSVDDSHVDSTFSWEAAPAYLAWTTIARATRTSNVDDGVYILGTGSGVPGFDLTADFTFIFFHRILSESSQRQEVFSYEFNGAADEDFHVFYNSEGVELTTRFRDDGGTLQTDSYAGDWDVEYEWRMSVVVFDVDGGTAGDPLITMYDFEANTGHEVRLREWDPASTPQPLGTSSPESDMVVSWSMELSLLGEYYDKAHHIVIGSVLTEANLKTIAELGVSWEEWTAVDFPTVEDHDEVEPAFSTTHAIDMPATVDLDDLLVMLISYGLNDTVITGPSGWTEIQPPLDSGNVVTTVIYAKAADGSEGGGSASLTTSSNTFVQAQVYRLSGWYPSHDPSDSVEAGTAFVDAGDSSPDPPIATASWGIEKSLFIAMFGADAEPTISAYPTDYTDGMETRRGGGGGTATTLGSARRELQASSDTPDNFSISASEESVSNTIVIRPAPSVPIAWTDWQAVLDWHIAAGDFTEASLLLNVTSNGTMLADGSAAGNTPTVSGSLDEGADPICFGDDYSTEADGSGLDYIDASACGIDLTDTAWTICFVAEMSTGTDVAFSLGSANNNAIALYAAAGTTLYFRAHWGSFPYDTLAMATGSLFGVTIKRDGNDLDWWVNGTHQGTLDVTSNTWSTSTDLRFLNGIVTGAGEWDGRMQRITVWDATIDDVLCLAFSKRHYGLIEPAEP